ncbi:hypothetical protein IVB18_14235 [Bradyrhizobium sp. 186]|uniref:hypothetical protein n=1 Tax=Bradyrhizobium sp. 186 TaxID=2782654 RepID=UPI002001AC33|nr:hypothetical protein [Bradyrhizobium sp. 186]UPK38293.1 hypothetical protein IVB18_14235 [Bradyrhizobium sp. 186]
MELADHLKQGTPMEFATVRELVMAIIVHASPSRPGGAGTKANAEDDRSVRIDIKGRLAALCGNSVLFPNMAMSGGTLVAGERLEPPTGRVIHHHSQTTVAGTDRLVAARLISFRVKAYQSMN